MKSSRLMLAALLLSGSLPCSAESPEALKAGSFSAFAFYLPAEMPTPRPEYSSANMGAGVRHTSISNLNLGLVFGIKDYQLGDEWGKKPVTAASAGGESAVFQRAAKATARYGGATAFYLGVFNGHHMMATNHHVVDGTGCGSSAHFPLLGKSFRCEKIYGDWKEIDLAVFSITVPAGGEAVLTGIGGNFAFDAPIYPGQKLLTIGFGVAGNAGRSLMANQDADCKVFSGLGEFRKMADPDDFNPGPDRVWSFASGCDISHGDSGSAFVDRETGQVLGLIWTGRIPKSPQVSSSAYLDGMLSAGSPEIWTELSYTVPAAKIRDGINDALTGPLSADAAATLRAIIAPPPAVAAVP